MSRHRRIKTLLYEEETKMFSFTPHLGKCRKINESKDKMENICEFRDIVKISTQEFVFRSFILLLLAFRGS